MSITSFHLLERCQWVDYPTEVIGMSELARYILAIFLTNKYLASASSRGLWRYTVEDYKSRNALPNKLQ